MPDATCDVDDCDRTDIKARGWCGMHYARWKTHGDPTHTERNYGQEGCKVEGCEDLHHGKGWCNKHYRRWRRRGTPTYTESYVCDSCGQDFTRPPARGQRPRWCDQCAPGADVTFVAGSCARCGDSYIAPYQPSARYCSPTCRDRENHRRRRAAQYGAERIPYDDTDIFQRDGWRCQICRRKVRRDVNYMHRHAPTIDHIVPLSAGGSDRPINVQTTHRICNMKKSVGPGQLRLIS